MKSSSQRRQLARLSLVAGCLAAAGAMAADSVPAIMQVPAGNYVAWRASAEGTVTYVCHQSSDIPPQLAWTIESAKATLNGDNQQGRYTSPPETWRAADGSWLTGMSVVRVDDGAGRLADQLVMANPSGAAGMLSGVTYIQRLVQSGGGAPDSVCDSAALGKQVTVPYQALYVFWKPN
ncbi:DUF3455 domain-containing protein [Bordetella sp. 02P26C-1]|uniref:DUF3455 domain-containing protein n=1 Tax=Bordetella sp. 02P26C-1 TaxID=2683195 RepID=UPI0013526BFF|nr:DUF3455 domain-containing protein [Bordetella sp. 02P26C-1]MVW77713.1 DUF3455 domain-containing protein [Bordetella sp. 02P26C-1]